MHLKSFGDSLWPHILLPWPSGWDPTLTRDSQVAGSNPGKGHWWTTGRAPGPKMLNAPEKSQLTIGHRPSPVKTGSVWRKTTSSLHCGLMYSCISQLVIYIRRSGEVPRYCDCHWSAISNFLPRCFCVMAVQELFLKRVAIFDCDFFAWSPFPAQKRILKSCLNLWLAPTVAKVQRCWWWFYRYRDYVLFRRKYF